MDTISLKKYIYEKDKVEYVLDKIGCHNIKYHSMKDYYSCSNFNGDNPTAINVKNNEYLNVTNWTRSDFDKNADIITLVQYNKNYSFIESVKYLHKILNITYTKSKKPVQKTKQILTLKNIFESISTEYTVNVADIRTIPEATLDDYIPLLFIDWFREGIMPWTAKKFHLAYSYRYSRIIIPHRSWLIGELVGINARTTIKNYDILGIKKYWITPSYQKSLNLYGLWENKESIQKAGYIVVAESEKSVLKRDSYGDGTVVALSGKIISQEQIRILIGLNVEIIIALDNDVSVQEMRFMCEYFYLKRIVSYIHDTDGILGDKDSPMDVGNRNYQKLFNNRIRYDEKEHRKYLKELQNKK